MSTFSYSGDPASSPRDLLRFLIGDTDTAHAANQLFTDLEMDYLVSQYSDPYLAASTALQRAIITVGSYVQSKRVGDLEITYGDRLAGLKGQMEWLRGQATGGQVGISCGGISISANRTAEGDTDRVKPAFRLGMMTWARPEPPVEVE